MTFLVSIVMSEYPDVEEDSSEVMGIPSVGDIIQGTFGSWYKVTYVAVHNMNTNSDKAATLLVTRNYTPVWVK